MKNKLFMVFLICCIILTACSTAQKSDSDNSESVQSALTSEASAASGEELTVPDVEAGIDNINKYGNITLTIGPDSMKKLGYEPADIITVKIGDSKMEMPIGTAYSDVNSGNPLCCFKTDATETGKTEYVILVINAGNMAKSLGIAESHIIDQDPGYEWTYLNGLDESVPVYISMVQKQGYADEYFSRQLGTTRSNNREDYPNLSDEEYANFRVIETTGMGKGTLYRSSSPVNPYLNRNKEADDALLTAQIRTVINTSDNEATMKSFADYILTNYKDCDIIALDMSVDTQSRNFQDSLAEACRFIISHDGPYLIHCTEGKDRTGYVSAILECLMGADADEIVTDYMLSYYNFYGLEPGTEKYEQIAASNIDSILASILGISSIREEGTDLQACAETYLQKIGLSAEEISALKDRLGKSYQ